MMRPDQFARVTTLLGRRAPRRHVRAQSARGERARKVGRVLHHAGRLLVLAFLALWLVASISALLNRPAYLAAQERQRVDALADENRTYCERWGFSENSHAFNLCALDLDEIRARERERATTLSFPP